MRTDIGYFEEGQLGKTYDVKLLRRMVPFIRPFAKPIFWSVLLVVCITLLDLALPYLTKVAIDRYIVPKAETAAEKSPDGPKTNTRWITADLDRTDVRAVVGHHPDLFLVKGSQALITLADLDHLDKREIAVIRQNDIEGLGYISLLFLAIIVLDFIFNFFQKLIMQYTGQMIMHNLRMRLFTHIQNLSMAFFTRNPVGRLVTRVTNDVQNMDELFTSVITFIFKDLFLLFGIGVVLIALNWKLALAAFAVMPIVFAATAVFSVKARDIFRILRIKIAEINTRFAETIGGIKVIQLFRNETDNYRQFEKLNHENYLAGMRQIRVLGLFLPAVEVLGVLATAIVIYYGGGETLTGTLSLGSLVAFISYMKMFFRPIRDLAEKYNILQNAMASAERIFLILDSRSRLPLPAPGDREHRLAKIETIDLDNVFFHYVADEPVLQAIDLTFKAGETLGVVGPTGSGKTTLVNLLTRFYDPSSGQVRINGRDLRDYDPQAFRSKMALVMQDPFLFSETVKKNIFRADGHMTPAEMDTILKMSNCVALIDRLPDGPETVLSEGGASISSGERQLISIARAFARNPQLILFDEATSYIDSETEIKIQDAMEKLMRGRTSVIVAHRLSTVRHADRIIVLNRGRIVETGSHEELMDRRGFYYRLHQVQG
ncbi:MAG: ABC transporter ATP-binding protein [Desulfobacterales bacterium]|jgi:ATP-binding cassette subfamily B protein